MIRKISQVLVMLMLLSVVLSVPAWGAADKGTDAPSSVTYEMKEIAVQYAAEFTAYPVDSLGKPTVSKSVYEAVYSDEPRPLQVLYGVVKLTNVLGYSFNEEFISVTDGVYTARGLSNGGSRIYNEFNQVKGQKTEFVTGKKLAGSSVVKDYSDGWKTVQLARTWDDYGNPIGFTIRFDGTFQPESDPFFQKLKDTAFVVDLSTLRHKGGSQAVQP
ncbi:hypothetical protein [Paenibacillus roseipurpureus]|uniref:Uncharacterized protein n=1 Tax=Paenibacillus roseopurpureus TaxID=2918901 RepID=A0AA96LPH6_9BACL|nr:hypothetical protein [Paenibacillus sp. MBLB1832]WNR44911.1 hypothetical protein MJB10_01805 [Paenibacillus sp. MBLB1832]